MVLTKNTYRNTVMKESQIAVMEEFVDNVKILINALGYKVLDPLLQIGTDVTSADDEELFINTGSTSATGMVTSEGFVVLKGAVVNEKTSAKSLSAGMKKLRDKIFADGKVENMTTTEDILFSSSSAVLNSSLVIAQAALVHGRQRMVVHLRKLRTTLQRIKPFNYSMKN